MSADPLLDLLRGAIPEGGKLTLQAFNEFLDTAIANADNFFNFNETTNVSNRSYQSTIFYSGSLGPEAGNVYTGEIARDLANRSSGQIRVLDNTKIGRILISITQNSGLSGIPIEGSLADFVDLAGKKFTPASAQFTALTEGAVTTIIGRTASPSGVHAATEIPEILTNSKITSVNGESMASVKAALPNTAGLTPEAKNSFYLSKFENDFYSKVYKPVRRVSRRRNPPTVSM